MTKYLAGVLSVIAAGTLLIAYGLLNPRAAAADGAMLVRPAYQSDRVQLLDPNANAVYGNGYAAYPVAYRSQDFQPERVVETYPAPRRAVVTRPVRYEQERPVRVVRREPQRDWKKSAIIIGGSSAAGAGLGAIFGGKKGALIGAAIGGGASTIYEVNKKR